MVHKILIALVLVLVAVPAASAAAPPSDDMPLVPQQIPVPPEILAAHPNGVPIVARAVTAPLPLPATSGDPRRTAARRDTERVTCWRAYFTGDNGGWFGTEQETINPYWCGNGSVTRTADTSWHYQTCSLLVSCEGESGPFTWFGCTYGCASYGGEVIGRFSVFVFTAVHVDETVLFELYGNGQYWGYSYHN